MVSTIIKKQFLPVVRMAVGVTAALFFTSCAGSIRLEKIEPFGIIGNDAQLYIAAPVKNNDVLLKQILHRFFSKEAVQQYLRRTSFINAGIVFDKKEIRICSLGSYPASLSGNIFSKKNGWEKREVALSVLRNKVNRGIPYYHSQMVDASLAVRGLALVCAGGSANSAEIRSTAAFLERVYNPVSVVLPSRFESACSTGDTIAIYSNRPQVLLSLFIGSSDIEFPISTIQFYFSPQENGTYLYNAVLETPDKRSAFFVKLLAGKFFSADTVSIAGKAVIIQNAVSTKDEIASFLFR